METSKRRDCDLIFYGSFKSPCLKMEWRPQKEGIATTSCAPILCAAFFWMEWRPQKEGIATCAQLSSGSATGRRWNGDLKKKGLRLRIPMNIYYISLMEWRPQKEGIATGISLKTLFTLLMEWRPQKEGIATHAHKEKESILSRWNGDLKKKGLRHQRAYSYKPP